MLHGMTNTNAMPQYVSTGPVTFARAEDDVVSPPFAALKELANTREALDTTISMLIGRLQPYADDQTAEPVGPATPLDRLPGASSLERQINGEASYLGELNDRLLELHRRLRL